MQLKWEVFQNLYNRLKQNKTNKHAKIRILFSTINGQRKIKDCTFQGLLQVLWNIYEINDLLAIAIFMIKDKQAQPIFKYTTAHNITELKPADNGNRIIQRWKNISPKAKTIYTEMTALKIQEEINEQFNI